MASSMQAIIDVLEESIKCSICMERCKKPRGLPCMHTYCLECLLLLIDKSGTSDGIFYCPTCRAWNKAPFEGWTPRNGPESFACKILAQALDRLNVDKLRTIEQEQKELCRALPFTDVQDLNFAALSLSSDKAPSSGEAPSLSDKAPQFEARVISQFTTRFPPCDVACTPDGNIVLNQNAGNQVFVFRPDGHILTKLQIEKNGFMVTAVACNDEFIYVANNLNDDKNILVYNYNGSYSSTIEVGYDSDTGIFASDGTLFVTSHGNNTMYSVDLLTGIRRLFPTEVELKSPAYVTATPTKVALSCWGDKTVHMFDRSGHHQFTYTGEGAPVGTVGLPCGVAIDSKGRLLVGHSDAEVDTVHIVSPSGQYLNHIDVRQHGLRNVAGMCVNHLDQLVISTATSQDILTYEYEIH